MRFDRLFDDLEAQLSAQLEAEHAHQGHEEERLRLARLSLRDRIAALKLHGGSIRLRLADRSIVELVPATVGKDWFAAELPNGGQCVVPLSAVSAVALAPPQLRASRERMPAASAPGPLLDRIGVGVVLRDLARRRVAVDVHLLSEPAPLHGTIDRVGSDHLELAVHERDRPRRERNVTEHLLVGLGAVMRLTV